MKKPRMVLQEIGQLVEQHGLDRELMRNPYTDLSGADIRRKWQEVQQSIPKRDAQLQNEYHRQQSKSFRKLEVFAFFTKNRARVIAFLSPAAICWQGC